MCLFLYKVYIFNAANGNIKSSKGYIWIYEKDFSKKLLLEKVKKFYKG